MSRRKRRGRSATSFVHKTYDLLDDQTVSEVVSWDEKGIFFEIKDVVTFTTVVLPRYFRHSNFNSFVRQLNLYDFRKEPGRFAFAHPSFTKGDKTQLRKLKRKVVKHEVSKLADIPVHEDLQGILEKIAMIQRSQLELQVHLSTLQDRSQTFQETRDLINSEVSKFKEMCGRMDHVAGLLSEYSDQCWKIEEKQMEPRKFGYEALQMERKDEGEDERRRSEGLIRTEV